MDFAAISGAPFLQAVLVMVLAAYSQYLSLRAGIFSIGTVGFMAIGAYATAILTVRHGVPWGLAVVVAVVICALAGLILGRLIDRLRGAYQAIATFAFVEVIQAAIQQWSGLTHGLFGISGVPFFGTTSVLVAFVVVVVVLVPVFELTRLGRRQRAVYHDEVAAAACGVDVVRSRLAALVVSAAVAGLAGAAQAGNQLAVDPSTFGFALVVTVLSAVIIGGTRSFVGPVLGAIVVTALPLLFDRYQALSSISNAIVTVAIMLVVPKGVGSLLPIDSSVLYRLLRRRPKPKADVTAPPGALDGDVPAASGQLSLAAVSRSFGGVKAVDSLSMTVSQGQVVGLIGPNGAGKSTVVNLVAGVYALDDGHISILEKAIDRDPAFRVVHAGLARTFQTCRLFAELTVWDNVLLAASSGRSRQRRASVSDTACAQEALALVGCTDLVDRVATELPYSDQRRVEIARAIATEPTFLLLDEPAAGMPELEARALADVVRAIATSGIGVLVIDHNVGWICSISDHVVVQNFGKVIASGDPDSVINEPAVVEAYIGKDRASAGVP